MIIRILLMIGIVFRVLIRPFYFSWLNFIILFVYLVSLACLIGKVKWSIFWIWGSALGSILFYFIFNDGILYSLGLDILLIVLGFIAFLFEKDLNWRFK